MKHALQGYNLQVTYAPENKVIKLLKPIALALVQSSAGANAEPPDSDYWLGLHCVVAVSLESHRDLCIALINTAAQHWPTKPIIKATFHCSLSATALSLP